MQIDINTLPKQALDWLTIAQQGDNISFVKSGQVIATIAIQKNTLANKASTNVMSTDTSQKRKAGLLAGKKLDPAFFDVLDATELDLW